MRIEIHGVPVVLKNIENAFEDIKRNSVKGLIKCQVTLTRKAMPITPLSLGGGNLRGSYNSPIPKEVLPGVWVAIVENSADYAAKVHEMPEETNWTTEGTGPKFLERPLFENTNEFLELIRTG
jgi:hypothetical protein